MIVRDNLSTIERYKELISKKVEYVNEDKIDILSILQDEKNGITKYSKPNLEVVNSIRNTILGYQYEILIGLYSEGEKIEKITQQFKNTIEDMVGVWHQSNGYVQMVWMLSIGILLDVNRDEFNKLLELVKADNPNDYLIDFLLNSKEDWEQNHTDFKFPVPYKSLRDVITLAYNNKKDESIIRLKDYLDNEWYKGHSDTGWYDSHKSKHNTYYGYWSWESGALVKILGLNDAILKNQQYYPYDMVHLKD